MNPQVDRSPGGPGRSRIAALVAMAVTTLALATACGSSSHPAAAANPSTAIVPGSGQSLAGAPGATATGPLADASACRHDRYAGMTMPTATGSAAHPRRRSPVTPCRSRTSPSPRPR